MVAPGIPEAGLLDRCHRNYAETLWQYIRSIPGAARRDLPDATLIRCDLPSSLTNVLFFPNPRSAPRERLREARTYFGPKLPWRVLTSGERASEVGSAAVGLGLRPAPNEPGMLLDPIRSIPQAPGSLTIRPVKDLTSLADFGVVWSEAFRFPRWVLPVVLSHPPSDDSERAAQNRFFVGYVDGRPVACSTVTVTERVAGIASVGTIPSARRRGIGTAMTWAAVDAGRALGADTAYLAASTMGYPVYERMGFRRAAEYPCWHVPVGLVRTLRAFRTVRRLVRRQRNPRPNFAPRGSRR
jgi:GNAT superfamily N-acetyltransferase